MKINLKNAIKGFFRNASLGLKKNAPAICTTLGLAGMGATVVMVHKISPKVHKVLEEDPNATKIEKAKKVAKIYWPAALSFATSGALIIGGNRMYSKRNLALAASASLAQKELLDWQQAAVEKVGEDTVSEIKEKIAEKRVSKIDTTQVDVQNEGNGPDLFYEPITDHLFYFDKTQLQRVENEANADLFAYDNISLADVYTRLGLKESRVAQCLWFDIREGKQGFIKFNTTPSKTADGRLCWELTFESNPKGDFPYEW